MDTTNNSRTFHPVIEAAYNRAHRWLEEQLGGDDYKRVSWNTITSNLTENTLFSVATQFFGLFHAHFHKTEHTLESVIGDNDLLKILERQNRICVLDVGCGGGSATAALINTVLRLSESVEDKMQYRIKVWALDPNEHALALYYFFMTYLSEELSNTKLVMEFELITPSTGVPDDAIAVIEKLYRAKINWDKPSLTHLFILQSNIVYPLSSVHSSQNIAIRELQRYGVPIEPSTESFGKRLALAYKQVLQEVPIDNVVVITIGTRNKDKENTPLSARVADMADVINLAFKESGHTCTLTISDEQTVHYINPQGSYWRDMKESLNGKSKFFFAVNQITNRHLMEDSDWRRILDLDNLKLAWARARSNLLREALYDEIEIRLFERDLQANLVQLQVALQTYHEEIIDDNSLILFDRPKNNLESRPYALTRLEEEILMVALIQQMGLTTIGIRSDSYAYRLHDNSRHRNENLYKSWFELYVLFIGDVRSAATNASNQSTIIETDIQSYYTRIVQQQLVEISVKELRTTSDRISWLVRRLLQRRLSEVYHESGYGLAQGSIGSGFFANAYLTPLDNLLGANNPWGLDYFRYVDDIILIVPESKKINEILKSVNDVLQNLDLQLNTSKTVQYSSIHEFLEVTANDEKLQDLSEQYNMLLDALWIMDGRHRQIFRQSYYQSNEAWWSVVQHYSTCLAKVGIFFTVTEMSRRISVFLFSTSLRESKLHKVPLLQLPELPDFIDLQRYSDWMMDFLNLSANASWLRLLSDLRGRFEDLFLTAFEELDFASPDKRIRRDLRFSGKRLLALGLSNLQVANKLYDLLLHVPWVLGEPREFVDGLALNNRHDLIWRIYEHFRGESAPYSEYMRTICLRSTRYFPEFTQEIFDAVFAHCIEGNGDAERLMASESLIFRPKDVENFMSESQVEDLKSIIFSQDDLNPRLIRNFVLLASMFCNPSDFDELYMHQNNTIAQAVNVVKLGQLQDLISTEEPEILRRTYYPGVYSRDGVEGLYSS